MAKDERLLLVQLDNGSTMRILTTLAVAQDTMRLWYHQAANDQFSKCMGSADLGFCFIPGEVVGMAIDLIDEQYDIDVELAKRRLQRERRDDDIAGFGDDKD